MNFNTEPNEKDRLLGVAMALMDELGYDKMTIRKICDEADISIGKFYRYFDSKLSLLSFFYNQAEEKYFQECEPLLKGKEIGQQLIEFYTWYGQYLENAGYEFVYNFFVNQNPAMNTHVYSNAIINITDNLMIEALQNGQALPKDIKIRDISNKLCVIVKGIIFDWNARHGEFSLSEEICDLLTRCMDGLLTVR